MKRLLEEAKRVIRIGSVSADGNEELANHLASVLSERGFKVQLQQVMHSLENVSKRQFNVIGILGDPLVDRKTRKGLLLGAHLDTVSPGVLQNWTETGGDPFLAVIQDGKIFGLGSADQKLDFLCKLHAAEKFKDRKLKMPLYLVGTAGEELGGLGAQYLIRSLALNPRFVVIGAPTELKVAYAHKSQTGIGVKIQFQLISKDAKGFNRRVCLQVFGQSAHGASPHLGTNALLELLRFLQTAEAGGFDIRFSRLEGGDCVNKVPDKAAAEFFLTSHQFEDFKIFCEQYQESSQSKARFQLEFGGLGETGVRFFPEAVFPCWAEVWECFKTLSSCFEAEKDFSYTLSASTVNLGQIRQTPAGLELFFDLRLLPEVAFEDVQKRIQEGMRAIVARYPQLSIEVSSKRLNPGLKMTLEQDLVKICQNVMEVAGLQGGFQKKSISTEAALFSQAGFEAVAFGPGVSYGNGHGPNEYNFLDHLEKAIVFYEKLIERVCL